LHSFHFKVAPPPNRRGGGQLGARPQATAPRPTSPHRPSFDTGSIGGKMVGQLVIRFRVWTPLDHLRSRRKVRVAPFGLWATNRITNPNPSVIRSPCNRPLRGCSCPAPSCIPLRIVVWLDVAAPPLAFGLLSLIPCVPVQLGPTTWFAPRPER